MPYHLSQDIPNIEDRLLEDRLMDDDEASF